MDRIKGPDSENMTTADNQTKAKTVQRNDDSRNKDAQILASLRRKNPDEARFDETSQPEDSSRTTSEESNLSNSKTRVEALRRSRTSSAPKEPMSSVSPTIRKLRHDLVEDADEERDSTVYDSRPQSRKTVYDDEGERVATSKNGYETRDAASLSDVMVVSDLHKGYQMGKKKVPVLRGVNLTVHKGEFLAVVGQSGSGKSTLLHLMGTLDTPDSGTIYFDGQRIDNLSIGQRDVLRNHFIGMIFQFYHLLPELTVFENVLAPLMIRDSVLGYLRKKRQYAREAEELLNLVGLSHRLKHRPNELSGGEMQRASIARALISNPHLLLADEPTGHLDSKASIGVLELLRELNEKKKLTVVMVTHDLGQAQDADRAIRIVDGQVVHESRS